MWAKQSAVYDCLVPFDEKNHGNHSHESRCATIIIRPLHSTVYVDAAYC